MWYLNQPILTFVQKNNIWKRNKLSMFFFFCWGYCENKRKLRPPLTPWKVLAKTCLSSPETYSTSCLWLDWGWKHLKFNNSKQLQMKRLYFLTVNQTTNSEPIHKRKRQFCVFASTLQLSTPWKQMEAYKFSILDLYSSYSPCGRIYILRCSRDLTVQLCILVT